MSLSRLAAVSINCQAVDILSGDSFDRQSISLHRLLLRLTLNYVSYSCQWDKCETCFSLIYRTF